LKSLKRAAYGVSPLGHYGLAKVNYTHFTSPIRRYADLVVHRVLGDHGDGRQRLAAKDLPAVALHISQTERTAEEAERESVKLKKIEFFMIAANRGETFEAVILDVRNFGLVVELPQYLINGLIHVSVLSDDFYLFDPVRFRFIGRQHRRTFGVGDRVQVVVANVDLHKQQIDFKPAPEPEREAKRTKGAKAGTKARAPRPAKPDRRPSSPQPPQRKRRRR